MIRKNLISLSVAFAFLSLSVTGLLLYIGKKPHLVETIHVIFGLVFIGFAVFHITNNWSSLTSYMKGGAKGNVRKELLLVLVFFVLFLLGSAFEIAPFPQLKEAGENFFREKRERRSQKISFESISTNQNERGIPITLIIQKNKDVPHPAMTIWVEDADHHFAGNLFAPAVLASAPEDNDEVLTMKPFSRALFPHWSAVAGTSMPNYPQATPEENFILMTKAVLTDKATIWLEILNGDHAELYSGEIDLSKARICELRSKDNSFLARAIVEIK